MWADEDKQYAVRRNIAPPIPLLPLPLGKAILEEKYFFPFCLYRTGSGLLSPGVALCCTLFVSFYISFSPSNPFEYLILVFSILAIKIYDCGAEMNAQARIRSPGSFNVRNFVREKYYSGVTPLLKRSNKC